MKGTDERPKRAPNMLKWWRCDVIRGSCYVILGLNEPIFRRKWLQGRGLPLWWVPTINKPSRHKDLRPIMVGSADPDRRNAFIIKEIRPSTKWEKSFACIKKFIRLLIFWMGRIVAAEGVQNGLKRPFTPMKRRFTRASFWQLEAVFARKVIVGKWIGKRPPPGTSIPNEGKDLQPTMAGGSRDDRRKS